MEPSWDHFWAIVFHLEALQERYQDDVETINLFEDVRSEVGLDCRAGRDGIPRPCSFSQDVPSENAIFNMTGRKPPLSTS